MKLAIATAGMMAGRHVGLNPKDLLAQGGKLVGGSPELKKLAGEARERLMDAAKAAAIAAATNKIDSIGDNLTKRAAGLRAPDVGEQASGLGKRVSGLGKRTSEETPEEDLGADEAATEEREEEEQEQAPERSPRSADGARGRMAERSSSARSPRHSEPSGRRGGSAAKKETVPRPRSSDQDDSKTASSTEARGRSSGGAGSQSRSGATSQRKSGTSSKPAAPKKSS
ncbi:hypothetical protein [Saccharopolyspora sp. NPDC002376]